MKIKELMEILKDLDPELDIIVSEDPEGNHYQHLHAYCSDMYYTGDYNCEIGYNKITPELIKQGYGEEDILENGKPCLILWP